MGVKKQVLPNEELEILERAFHAERYDKNVGVSLSVFTPQSHGGERTWK
jgi:hypothetical protein